jgi:hypothetical protein
MSDKGRFAPFRSVAGHGTSPAKHTLGVLAARTIGNRRLLHRQTAA